MEMSNRDRRRYPRSELRAQITFELDGSKWQGTIINFSEIGLLIQSEHLLPPGKKVKIPIVLPGKGIFYLHGEVIWSKDFCEGRAEDKSQGFMGVELSAVPVEYLKAVSDLRKRLEASPSRNPRERYEVFHRVRFQSGEMFLTEYTENLNQGGMYIATAENLEPGTILKAQLEIPGFGEPLKIKGRVAYRLDQVTAKAKGRTPGVGIQFLDLSTKVRDQLDHYVRRLAIHRSDPQKSLNTEVPNNGALKEFLVPELILGISSKESTGILKLTHKSVKKKVYFQKGKPVFVDSSLPSETLGQFLTRRGLLPLQNLAKWLPLIEGSDSMVATNLVREKFMDEETIIDALVEHQEERLTNTFPWFEGSFEFTYDTDWPKTIMILPLQSHRIVFSGIVHWYDSTLVSSWMGLNELSTLRRERSPSSDHVLSHLAYQILFELWAPQTLKALGKSTGIPMKTLLPAAYALIISKWASLEFLLQKEKTKKPTVKPEKKPPKKKQETPTNWKLLIEEDFSRLGNLDYYELLGIDENASEVEITKAYLDRTARYSKESVTMEHFQDKELLQKISQILAWIRTAYDTLLDPTIRDAYKKEKTERKAQKIKADIMETDQVVLRAMSEMHEGNPKKAIEILEDRAKLKPFHPTVAGWYGWALFNEHREKNLNDALSLISKAIEQDPSDPHLYYFLGEISAHSQKWKEAESAYLQAVRLQSNFTQAKLGLDQTRKNMLISNQQNAN